MKEDGYGLVVSVDFSPIVIQQMRDKYGPKSNYEVLDVTKSFPYPENSFDIIVCKGTMDSILCGAGSLKNIRNTLMECSRVLNNEYGALVIITYGSPVDRMLYIEDEAFGWTIDVFTVPKPRTVGSDIHETKSSAKEHYVYICKKGNINATYSGKQTDIQNIENAETASPKLSVKQESQTAEARVDEIS
jgi:ubiquinone/menaquinone biosynthesis C-methylase UbiE